MLLEDDDFLIKAEKNDWLHFSSPLATIIASSVDEVLPSLATVEKWVAKNYYAAGFISYEASPAFNPTHECHRLGDFPLLLFSIYQKPALISAEELVSQQRVDTEQINWQYQTDFEEYLENIKDIKTEISNGATYQVNHTIRLAAENINKNSPFNFFLNHIIVQDAGYSAYWQNKDFALASASPELFFEKKNTRITARPMKGTRARGKTLEEDSRLKQQLQDSIKDRAENVMILDMLRNDLGKISQNKVSVKDIFKIEDYSTVFQMTSTVTAESEASITDIFSSLFPCASITGAPKVQTMKIISQLENSPRGLYTGCIGYINPNNTARFSVAIRTASFNRNKKEAIYGVGGGIVWDSTPADEFAECKAKAAILNQTLNEPSEDFQLLETLLYEPEQGVFILQEHLNRLETSARFFQFQFNKDEITKNLLKVSSPSPLRLRLLLQKDGKFRLEQDPFNTTEQPRVLQLSKHPVNSGNPFLRHKTTNRTIYQEAAADKAEGVDDIVLYNKKGEITETTICNIVVVQNGRKYTPPVSSGLLPGTFRQALLSKKEIYEKVIRVEDLLGAEEVWLINSLRKWIPVKLPVLKYC